MTSSPPNGQNITSRQERYAKLKVDLQTYGSVVIAFSGGVDSTFLLKVAIDVLGLEAVLALTATSPIRNSSFARPATWQCGSAPGSWWSRATSWRSPVSPRTIGAAVTIASRSCSTSAVTTRENSATRRSSTARISTTCRTSAPAATPRLSWRSVLRCSRQGSASRPSPAGRPGSPTAPRSLPRGLRRIDRCETFLREQGFGNYRVRCHGEVARIEIAPAESERTSSQPRHHAGVPNSPGRMGYRVVDFISNFVDLLRVLEDRVNFRSIRTRLSPQSSCQHRLKGKSCP